MKTYRTVYEGGEAETIVKKSRFIATVLPIQTEEEALDFIAVMKKKYWNATHNCFAYVVGDNNDIQRCSDDGEPSGTAGKPMLDVLLGEELHNVVVVVTRYFGGTLLGTGGLVRAYSSAVKEGLASSVIITKTVGVKLEIKTDYTDLGKVQYILAEAGVTTIEAVYTDSVEIIAMVPEERLEQMLEELTEGTRGKVALTELEKCHYAEIDGKIKVLED